MFCVQFCGRITSIHLAKIHFNIFLSKKSATLARKFDKTMNFRPYIPLCTLALLWASVPVGGQDVSLQKQLERKLADPALASAQVGVCVRKMSGETVAEINGKKMFVPASNMKVITTGSALHSLGGDFRFETTLAYSGRIEGGSLNGDLYIVGGADPTLASRDSIAQPIAALFADWTKMIKSAGIRRIEGHVVGDGRWFEAMPEEESWLWNDLGTYYGCGTTGLMFYENTQSFLISPGPKVGDNLKIEVYYPKTPWMEYRYECSTGAAKTGDLLYMYTTEFAPVGILRGTLGVDVKRKRVDCSNKFPEYTCAEYFADYLDKAGVPNGGAGDFRLGKTVGTQTYMPAGTPPLTKLGSTYSPTLRRIVFEANHASNNLYCEAILRTLGKLSTGSDCYDSSYVALNAALASVMQLPGKKIEGLHVKDGSGLSRQNYVSPDFFCRFLRNMMLSPSFEDFAASLPTPGGEGSLQYNMGSHSKALKERIIAKSGSMNGVRCYSGYVTPRNKCTDDTLIFSVMVNNCCAPTWKIKKILDEIMALIAENC